ncbi:MAG TPA: hypothetical protein VMV94_08240 [Phycisphaerae bacterium]|nr:hypothetical protein [Phycisphaerae bacterium]
MVLTGLKITFHAREQLNTERLLGAVPEIRPLSKMDPESVAAMTEWLDRHTKSASSRQSSGPSNDGVVKRMRRVA